jgi:hypothetical protein
MSHLHDELKRRCARHVDVHDLADTRRWYLEQMGKVEPPLYFDDLSPFEQRFFEKLCAGYRAWRAEQLKDIN